MKKAIVLTVLLVLSIILIITVAACSKNVPIETEKIERVEFRKDVPAELQIVNGNKTIKVYYYETRNYSQEQYRNIYLDQDRNEYHFYPDNRVASYILNKQVSAKKRSQKKKQTVLSEKELEQIAFSYASGLYQNPLDGFSTESIKYKEALNYYTVRFVKYYGNDSLKIIGPVVNVKIFPDGTVDACITSDFYDFENFNEASLSGLTKKDILDFAEDKVKALYNDFEEFQIKAVFLAKSKETFILNIHTEVKMNFEAKVLEIFPYAYSKA